MATADLFLLKRDVKDVEMKLLKRDYYKAQILQNCNHPSICFWGLFNEVRANEK